MYDHGDDDDEAAATMEEMEMEALAVGMGGGTPASQIQLLGDLADPRTRHVALIQLSERVLTQCLAGSMRIEGQGLNAEGQGLLAGLRRLLDIEVRRARRALKAART